MKFSATNSALFGSLVVGLRIACTVAATVLTPNIVSDLINGSSSSTGMLEADDPRFTLEITYDEIELPTTPVLMNVVELLAQYAEMEYMGRTHGRHGVVLESYPQIEIAVLPAAPSTSVQVRLVVWAIYGGMIELVGRNMFKQSDIAFSWEGRLVGNVYITKPLDDSSNPNNLTNGLTTPVVGNTTNLDASIGRFSWVVVYTPDAQNLPPKDVFIMVMGTIKLIAQHPMDEKVEGAFHMGSAFANAHVEVYLQSRRIPRTKPPYFQYSHLLEALRRTPAWMLQNRRFAEMYSLIASSTIRVGQMLLAKGPFVPPQNEITRGITFSRSDTIDDQR